MAIYIIQGLLGDSSEYVADGQILMPLLSTTKVGTISSKTTEKSYRKLIFFS
jgi:hypothetical protein